MLFNLPGYRVLTAIDDVDGARRALIEPVDLVGHCPDCAFDSVRAHSRPVSRVADVSIRGRLEGRVRKRRLWCDNDTCGRATFTQTTDQTGCDHVSPPGWQGGSSTRWGLRPGR